MSAPSKFDLSSDSTDRPSYAPGHRGPYGAASMDRSSSSHENLEYPLLSSLPNMIRNHSSVTQGDVLNFFQCVRFDPKSMVVEHKLNRPAEFKRIASAAVGIPLEDSTPSSSKSKQLSSSSLEDLRRLKSGVRESGTKARERVKILNDCLSVINKCFPTTPSRKRSRLDALSNDRSYTISPADRSAAGVGVGKLGSQNHTYASGVEPDQPKSKERTKSANLNKRPRTSVVDSRMDVRGNDPARQSGFKDKDRDLVRLHNGGVVPGDDRTLSISVDGWEKAKMKKKRTGIKLDIAASSMSTKPADGYRESKQGMQPRAPVEARSRLIDSHGFRSGIANEGASIGKAEATSQTSSGMRSSISRTDSENSSLLHERRERPGGVDKERANLKVVNKANSREDFSSGSPTSGSKLNVNVRGPRSGSVGGVSKLSQVVQRPSNDWEVSNCTSQLPGIIGANSRKRTPSARSSSPPVANWAQRPQKISRTPRRTNLSPIIPVNNDNPSVDMKSNMTVNERHFLAHSPQQVKLKSENFSPAAVSESEESGAAEVKLRDKSKKCDEIDDRSGQYDQKMSTVLLPPRKNKATGGEDHGDGVRRQGRTGRRLTSSRTLLPLAGEKLGNVGTTKQIRSSRLGFDKTESRPGRPPTRKLSDRKGYTRQKHIGVNVTADFLVGSDDGHEELLAAANAVTDAAQALSSPFWKNMETLFRFISDRDISYLKDQVNLDLAVDTEAPAPCDTDSSTVLHTECGLNGFGGEESEMRSFLLSPESLTPGAKTPNDTSLFQRLMSAFIPEEEDQHLFVAHKEEKYDVYGSKYETGKDGEADTFSPRLSQSCGLSGSPSSNGYGVYSNGMSFYGLDSFVRQTDIVSNPDTGVILGNDNSQNGLLAEDIPVSACSKYEYHNMSVSERLLLELKSIGVYPDLRPDLAEIGYEGLNGNLSRLEQQQQEKVSKKTRMLGKLLTAASEAKELQEKRFEGHALDELAKMAYGKYMGCWGPNAHGMKSASGKMAKQAALASVKRTLERYQEFEVTGKSCFSEPFYKDMFLSGVSRLADVQPLNSNMDNEYGKLYHSASGCSVEVRTSVPGSSEPSPSNNQEFYSSEALLSANLGSDNNGNEDSWSNRVKRRELLLDDVGGMVGTSPTVQSGLGGSLSCSAKGKRSEREREGKGNSREPLSKNRTTKLGRPALVTIKGERKSKAKHKQKTANLSSSNVSLGKKPDLPKVILPSALSSGVNTARDIDKDKNEYNLEMLEEPIDLSGLQLPEMGNFGVPDDLGGQGEDIGSWLNIEDDGLQDHDFMAGLQIPMDDLTDLNMMV